MQKTVLTNAELIRSGEAALRLGISTQWLYTLSNRGDVPYVAVGGWRLYSRIEIERLAQARKERTRAR